MPGPSYPGVVRAPVRRLLCVVAGLLVSGVPVAAQTQTGTVSGTVNGGLGEPLAGVQVSLVGTGLGSLTNANGHYTILNVPPAQYRLRSQMIGRRPVEQAITVVAGQTVTQDFVLKTQAIALDEVVITGTAGAARAREVGNSVSAIDVSKVAEPPRTLANCCRGARRE